MRRYASFICDSARWSTFELRAGDIVVTTPPKCGTTWMQTCCLSLLHGPELPAPLSTMAPWLDQLTEPFEEMTARLAAQPHRRVIKSHTPLDGLPQRDDVAYVVVGRDPRDVVLSMRDHFANMDMARINVLREAAGNPSEQWTIPARTAEDPLVAWIDDPGPAEDFRGSLLFTIHHLSQAWARREDPNVALFHYAELRADLPAELRRLAGFLDIEVADDDWPALVDAVSLETMRERADVAAPNAESGFWRDPKRFFAEGRVGAWRDRLTGETLDRYDCRVAELTDDRALLAWLHR